MDHGKLQASKAWGRMAPPSLTRTVNGRSLSRARGRGQPGCRAPKKLSQRWPLLWGCSLQDGASDLPAIVPSPWVGRVEARYRMTRYTLPSPFGSHVGQKSPLFNGQREEACRLLIVDTEAPNPVAGSCLPQLVSMAMHVSTLLAT